MPSLRERYEEFHAIDGRDIGIYQEVLAVLAAAEAWAQEKRESLIYKYGPNYTQHHDPTPCDAKLLALLPPPDAKETP